MEQMISYLLSHLVPVIIVVGILLRLFAYGRNAGRGGRRRNGPEGMPPFGRTHGAPHARTAESRAEYREPARETAAPTREEAGRVSRNDRSMREEQRTGSSPFGGTIVAGRAMSAAAPAASAPRSPALPSTIVQTAFPGEIGTAHEGMTTVSPPVRSPAAALDVSPEHAASGMIWSEIFGPPRAKRGFPRRR